MKQSLFYLMTFFLAARMAQGSEIKDVCTPLGKNWMVTRLTVYHKHWLTETPTSITPEMLVKSYTYRFESREGGQNPSSASDFLLHVDGKVIGKDRHEKFDCRWVFIVNDMDGHEKLLIYANPSLSIAVMNDTAFVPDKRFRDWVKAVFGTPFQIGDTVK